MLAKSSLCFCKRVYMFFARQTAGTIGTRLSTWIHFDPRVFTQKSEVKVNKVKVTENSYRLP